MNKYNNNMSNNFNRSPAGDSSMRFNKRPRYGINNSNNNLGATANNNNTRFQHHNSPVYQYPPNRNNSAAGDCQQSLQQQQQQHFDTSPRQFYGISPKRPNHNNHNNISPQQYLCKTMTSSTSLQSSTFGVPPPSTLEPNQPHMLSASISAPSSQRPPPPPPQAGGMMNSNNYYGFGYNNLYSNNFKPDLMVPPSSSVISFSSPDAMSPYMWETIKTTPPPPKLPILPQQLPPPPPLPSQPAPPMPPPPTSDLHATPAADSDSSTVPNTKANDQEKAQNPKTIVKMKTKRKAMSLRYKSCKLWCEEDALLALKAEEVNTKKLEKDIILIVRFPDPEITREMVKCYSPDIESVHFQLNFAPRFCLVHLKPGTDVEKTIDHLSKIPFGTGFLSVEIKQIPHKIHSTRPSEVDPYTLYVGNLPTTIASRTLKEHFPGASRIDIGFAQRMKYTRYAFIRFASVKLAIEAYNRAYDAEIDGRNLTIRFRRITSLIDGNKDGEQDVDHVSDDIHNDQQSTLEIEDRAEKFSHTLNANKSQSNVIAEEKNENDQQSALESEECTEKFSQRLNENTIQSNVLQEEKDENQNLQEVENEATNGESVRDRNECSTSKSSFDLSESNVVSNNSNNKQNSTETNNCTTTTTTEESVNKEQSNITPLLNIKPEPDLDPDDIVIRNNDITSRLPLNNENIKQEEQIAMYEEFFEAPSQPIESTIDTAHNTINNNTQVSLALSSADETDTMSNLSTNSLGEFLQNCQRNQSQNNINEIPEVPPNKRTKVTNNLFAETIKKEPTEENSNTAQSILTNLETLRNATTVKQEAGQEDQQNTNKTNRKENTKTSVGNILNTCTTNSLNSQISSTNIDEDVVPSTALFFRNSTNQNISTNQSCDYDEFYETTINNTAKSANIAQVKSEFLNQTTNLCTNHNDINTTTIQSNLRDSLSQHLSNRITSNVLANDIDENDLVPSQNLLGSYRPVQNGIKREMEHDDIFNVPFNNKKDGNDECISNTDSLDAANNKNGSKIESLNQTENVKDSEDDIIIISDSTTPSSNTVTSNNLVLGNLFFRQQPDLVTFQSKKITTPFIRRETSKLMLHHDNLDKLYEQLDADSDNDL